MPSIKKKKATPAKEVASVPVYELNLKTVHIRLKGLTPLIVHKFSEKAIKMIEDKQQHKGTSSAKKKGKRNPEEEFNGGRYILDEKKGIDGFPTSGFKKSAVRAASFMGMKMTEAMGAFQVMGYMTPIICKKGAKLRKDMVRIGQGTSDVRYRPEYEEWSVELEIRFQANVISAEQIVNMFNTAGFSTGVGEWRPQKGGSFGTFEVVI